VVFDPAHNSYTISGSGTNMWAASDEFHYLWKRMKGNFIVRSRVEFLGKGVEAHRKIGWIVRPSLDPDSPHVHATVHGNGLASLQFRRKKGDITQEIGAKINAPDVIQLERKGDKYFMSFARFGELFTTMEVSDIALGDELYVGLYVCAHNNSVV